MRYKHDHDKLTSFSKDQWLVLISPFYQVRNRLPFVVALKEGKKVEANGVSFFADSSFSFKPEHCEVSSRDGLID